MWNQSRVVALMHMQNNDQKVVEDLTTVRFMVPYHVLILLMGRLSIMVAYARAGSRVDSM